MPRNRARCPCLVWSTLLLSLTLVSPVLAQESAAEARARETEQQMTDDERFGLIHSLMVVVLRPDFSQERDKRVPANVPQTAGWVKGVPRLGVPDLVLTDAGLGITNPLGGRKGTPPPRCRPHRLWPPPSTPGWPTRPVPSSAAKRARAASTSCSAVA